MLSRVDVDDLLFAPVRARWLAEPGTVAADLLEAAGHGDRLEGVTAQEVTVRAARLLWDFGQREAGLALLEQVIRDNPPDADGQARYELAMVLAQAGDPEEAQAALLDSVSCERPGSMVDVFRRSRIADDFVYGGHLDLAAKWADNAVNAAELGTGPDHLAAIAWATRNRAEVLERSGSPVPRDRRRHGSCTCASPGRTARSTAGSGRRSRVAAWCGGRRPTMTGSYDRSMRLRISSGRDGAITSALSNRQCAQRQRCQENPYTWSLRA
jgi:hypothetical protein